MSQYSIVITIAGSAPRSHTIDKKLTLGAHEKNDIVLEDQGLSPRQCIFKITNGVLSIHNMGGKTPTHLGEQLLSHGKMYIIDSGDQINLNELVQIEVTVEQETDPLLELQSQGKEQLGIEEEVNEFKEITIARIIKGDLTDEESTNLEADSPPKLEQLKKAIIEDKKTQAAHKLMVDSIEEEEEEEEEFIEEEAKVDSDDDSKSGGSKILSIVTAVFKKKEKIENDLLIDIETEESLNLNKTKDKPEREEQKEDKEELEYKMPGIFLRILAVLSNLGLACTAGIYIDKFSFIPESISVLLPQQVLTIVISYLVIDFAFHIILATSLPLYLMGVREESGFITARVKAAIRAILGYATLPVLIFDLPILMDKRSGKEMVTRSNLNVKSKTLAFIKSLIIVPIFVLIPFVMPLVTNSKSFNQAPINTKPLLKKRKDTNSPNYNVSSMAFSLNLKTFIDPKYVFIPEVKKSGSKTKSTIHIVDLSKESSVAFQINKTIDVSKIIKLGARKNPLFRINYPSLHAFIEDKSTQLNSPGLLELESLLKSSLSLNKDDLVTTLQNHGPFFIGLIDIQNYFSEMFLPINNANIKIFSGKESFFITANPERVLTKNTMKVMMFTSSSLTIYDVTYKKNSQRIAQKLPKLFLSGITPFKKSDKKIKTEWSAFESIDLLLNLSNNTDSKKGIVSAEKADQMTSHYFNLAKNALNKSQQFYSIVLKSIRKSLKYLDTLESSDQDPLITAKESLARTYEALQNKNKFYFEQ